MTEDIYRHIADTLSGRFDVDRSVIGPDVAYKDMSLDSVSIVELFVMIEDVWGVVLDEDARLADLTVGQTVALINGVARR